MANRPIVTGIKLSPSIRVRLPNVNLGIPLTRWIPTDEISRPRIPITSPFALFLPLSVETIAIPNKISTKNSGGPNKITRGFRTGSDIANTMAPKIPPSAELVNAADSARDASPFLAIG